MTKINNSEKIEQLKEKDKSIKLIYSGGVGLSSRFRKRIHCSLWKLSKDSAPEFMGKKKVFYGKRTFKYKGQIYHIDYNLLKHGKRHFDYDHDVDNITGGLAFDKNKDMHSPNQLEEFIEALSENVFTARRGIPPLVLYIAMIVALIGVGGLAYFAMQYAEQNTLIESFKVENTNLKNTITILQNSLNSGG